MADHKGLPKIEINREWRVGSHTGKERVLTEIQVRNERREPVKKQKTLAEQHRAVFFWKSFSSFFCRSACGVPIKHRIRTKLNVSARTRHNAMEPSGDLSCSTEPRAPVHLPPSRSLGRQRPVVCWHPKFISGGVSERRLCVSVGHSFISPQETRAEPHSFHT